MTVDWEDFKMSRSLINKQDMKIQTGRRKTKGNEHKRQRGGATTYINLYYSKWIKKNAE